MKNQEKLTTKCKQVSTPADLDQATYHMCSIPLSWEYILQGVSWKKFTWFFLDFLDLSKPHQVSHVNIWKIYRESLK